ncbi:MAG: glycosyltransferase family 4 protein, partial [Nitrospirae bacterium]|nr:glycosyltransferase family 4 protein [Nitrospirota bacterium]
MNILYVLYGDFSSNSTNPLALYTRELSRRGHCCAVAVPSNLETIGLHDNPAFRPLLYTSVLASPSSVFPDGRPADIIHACTPREVVRRFIVTYMAEQPTPLVLYLEDNEYWISTRSLGLDEETLVQYTVQEILEMMPSSIAHPFYCDSFMGIADAVVVIQDKLMSMVPSWVPCKTIMIGVDLDFFSPRKPDHFLREKYGVAESEKVIVYHGGVNDFTRPAIRTLCEAIGLINQQGFRCRLLRTGPYPIDFLGQLSNQVTPFISDLGVLPKQDLPDLLALADVCVQPGKKDSFEDLRLPGKIPEWLAMGLPVVIPDANIAHLFKDGENATLLHNGCPEEIAEKCMDLFSHPQKASSIGRAGRLLAEKYFDVRVQATHLEEVYNSARLNFHSAISANIWQGKGVNFPFELRLALKLRLLASSEGATHIGDAGRLLQEYAKLMERMYQRIKGLEDRLAQEKGSVGHMAKSLSRIIVAPMRFFSRPPTYLFGQREFQGGLMLVVRKLKKIYLREGWPGI